MALEALMSSPAKPYIPHGGHDLEALLNTMLTVCHYTEGPGELCKINSERDKKLKLNRWFVEAELTDLAIWKTATLEAFNTFIKPALPVYWQDFAPYLYRLIEATWKDKPFIENPNSAMHQAYRNILTQALNHYNKTEADLPAVYAVIPAGKCQRTEESQSQLHGGKRQRTDVDPDVDPGSIIIPRNNDRHYLESFTESGLWLDTPSTSIFH